MGNNSTTSNFGGYSQPIGPQEVVTWESAKDDPQKLADMAGMDFNIDSKTGDYVFYDSENDLELRVNEDVIKNHSNDGSLNEIVRSVSVLPTINKQSTPAIVIYQDDTHPVTGLHSTYNEGGVKTGNHYVTIATSALKPSRGHSFMRTLLHETEHAHDYMMGDSKSRGGISNSKAFKDALKTDGPATAYSYRYHFKTLANGKLKKLAQSTVLRKNHNYLLESYAESASIVKLQMMGRGSEKVVDANGKLVTVDKWCENHKKTYEVIKNNTIDSPSDFKKQENYANQEIRDETNDWYRKAKLEYVKNLKERYNISHKKRK